MATQVVHWRADDGSFHESEQAAAMQDYQILLTAWLEAHPHLRWATASSPTAVASVLLMDKKCPFVLVPRPGIRDAEAAPTVSSDSTVKVVKPA